MSNDLILSEQHINALSFIARNAHASKFYASLGGEAGIMSILLLARELNVPSMQALSGGIWNIQGKVEMSARMMNMKIRQAGHKLKVACDSRHCKITGIRSDTGEEMTVEFTMDDATKAGLTGKAVWKQNPDDMLFARCLSKLARRLFPDVIGNCYVEGEIRDTPAVSHKSEDEDILPVIEEPKDRATKKSSKKIAPINETPIEYAAVENMEDFSDQQVNLIAPEQCAHILELIQGEQSRLTLLLSHYRISNIGELPAEKYEEVVEILSQGRAK